jgi:3-oxoacyl-[acyl-carrier protein] reductase
MLKDRVAIVTGAAAGIGFGIAKKFAENGCHIVLNVHRDLTEYPGAVERTKILQSSGVKCLVVKADVSDSKDVSRLVKEAFSAFGKIDILVNNAAYIAPRKTVFEIPEQEWDRVLAVNLKGPFIVSKEVVPYMKEAGWGRIINISAVSGTAPLAAFAHYNASKAGLNLLTKDMALELAAFNINVNCICPGLIHTELAESTSPEWMEKMAFIQQFAKDNVPKQKPGYPEDIANAALFFASELSSYVTGEVLLVAGGVPLMRSRIPKWTT